VTNASPAQLKKRSSSYVSRGWFCRRPDRGPAFGTRACARAQGAHPWREEAPRGDLSVRFRFGFRPPRRMNPPLDECCSPPRRAAPLAVCRQTGAVRRSRRARATLFARAPVIAPRAAGKTRSPAPETVRLSPFASTVSPSKPRSRQTVSPPPFSGTVCRPPFRPPPFASTVLTPRSPPPFAGTRSPAPFAGIVRRTVRPKAEKLKSSIPCGWPGPAARSLLRTHSDHLGALQPSPDLDSTAPRAVSPWPRGIRPAASIRSVGCPWLLPTCLQMITC